MSQPIVEKEAGPPAQPETPVEEPPAKEKRVREYKDFGHDEVKATHANVDMSRIELKADDLYDKEKVDLETIVIEDVFTLLQCNDQGLAAAEAQRRFEIFGPNKLEQEEQNPFLQVVHCILHSISI